MEKKKQKNDFSLIARYLGITIPASLLFVGTADAMPANGVRSVTETYAVQQENIKNNDIYKRVISFNGHPIDNSTYFAHVNNHTNTQNHTNQHTNIYHSDYHANRPGYGSGEACYPHSDSHTNRQGTNVHTDRTSNHTNRHSDIPDC